MSLHSKSIFGEATRWVASLFVLSLLLAGTCRGQDSTLTLTGTVRDTLGNPLKLVVVLLDGSPIGTMTNERGQYRISNAPAKQWPVKFMLWGFQEYRTEVPAPARGTMVVDVTLRAGSVPKLELTYSNHAMGGGKYWIPTLELAESFPEETSLDHTEIPETGGVWTYLFLGAHRTIDLAQFYLSEDPDGESQLTVVLLALRDAAHRGLAIRFLAEERFYKTYPTWLDSLARIPGIEVRRLDSAAFNGGVLHAKYFIVDGVTSYIGSQNFDWRSLEHIQELGVTVRDSTFTAGLRNVFEYDWTLAGLVPPGKFAAGAAAGVADSLLETRRVPPDDSWRVDPAVPGTGAPDTLRYRLVASPMSRIPNKASWELVPILRMIEESRDSVFVQLLTYKTTDRSGEKWPALDDALRLAAGRGVRVRLLVSNWCKRKGTVECLQDLLTVPNVEVRFMNIPEWSGGFIPFARTVHAKYMAVDGRRFWIGTSNWEKDYFFSSRNVAVVGESVEMGRRLSRFFRTGWDSEYAETVRAGVSYIPPRVSE